MSNNMSYVSMQNISKFFGSVTANKNVNLNVNTGEVHALLGENGAGKSTLMNMLSGVYTPDSGSIFINGKKVKFSSPKDAINSGIGMIYQHFKLVENMTAFENIILGQKTSSFFNKKSLRKEIIDICEKYDFKINIDKKIYNMSVGEKQIVEILKVLYRGANVLILDEPTTVFTPQETKKLFKIINIMKSEGCAIIFITHKMDEVMEVADKITVLRKGTSVKTLNKKDTNSKELTELMVGHPIDLSIKRSPRPEKSESVLEVEKLQILNEEGQKVIKDISFTMNKGEILGIAGIADSGQKEICEAIAGICPINNGKILFEGENIVGKTPKEIINKGISMSFVPEDRLGMGLVASMDMVDNLLLKEYHNQEGIFIDRKPMEELATTLVDDLEINTPNIYHPIKYLSGGNIQKVLLGRELNCNPKILIMAYPVRGLDINTCYTIYDLINAEKEKGTSILYIGEDLDVIMELCDRIMVMCHGEVTGIVDARKVTKDELGMLMVGKEVCLEGIADA